MMQRHMCSHLAREEIAINTLKVAVDPFLLDDLHQGNPKPASLK
jgi:hypothetical protein